MRQLLTRFFAGVCDLYFTAMTIGAVAALVLSVLQRSLPLLGALIVLFAAIAASLIYHVFLAKRATWLSPGERLVGDTILNGVKTPTNPFGISRWALFVVILFTLVLIGNTWDRMSEGHIYTVVEVIVRVIMLIAVSYGLVSMGTGNLRAVIYPIGYYLFVAAQGTNLPVSAANRAAILQIAVFFLGVAVAHAVIALVYHLLRKRQVVTQGT